MRYKLNETKKEYNQKNELQKAKNSRNAVALSNITTAVAENVGSALTRKFKQNIEAVPGAKDESKDLCNVYWRSALEAV